jgi:membrane-bound serine protease (ClpP class)
MAGIMRTPASHVARLLAAAALMLGASLALVPHSLPAQSGGHATLLTVHDAIGPATSHYVEKGLEEAAARGSEIVILEMDTPGGLDSAMRDIIRGILASPIPVVTFVHPQGARAASAGTYILYASHVAAMAPATNLGAATPVAIGGGSPVPMPGGGEPADPSGGDEPPDDAAAREAPTAPEPADASERKAVNDAVAYIRSLAEMRGRNAEWAEQAVRSAASLSARAALANDVIDLVATSLDDLLAQLDGRRIDMGAGATITLATDGLALERVEPDWRTRLLAVISNPTVAYMLMLIGIYGLIFEGYNPGAIIPGVVGAISLLLALFAFQVLPVNYAGLALILLGVILMIAEFLVPSFGALGIGGVAAFVFGSVILIDSDVPGFGISTPLLAAVALTAAGALFGTIWIAMRTRHAKVVSGVEEMRNSVAVALEDFETEGDVRAHGERWHARSSVPVRKGDTLRVLGVSNLVLTVVPDDSAPAAGDRPISTGPQK